MAPSPAAVGTLVHPVPLVAGNFAWNAATVVVDGEVGPKYRVSGRWRRSESGREG